MGQGKPVDLLRYRIYPASIVARCGGERRFEAGGAVPGQRRRHWVKSVLAQRPGEGTHIQRRAAQAVQQHHGTTGFGH
jgi:hypothetical protein